MLTRKQQNTLQLTTIRKIAAGQSRSQEMGSENSMSDSCVFDWHPPFRKRVGGKCIPTTALQNDRFKLKDITHYTNLLIKAKTS